MDYTFSIPGEPKGKGRARIYRTKFGVRGVTPQDTVLYENLVKIMYKGKYYDKDEEIIITITSGFNIPKSFSKKKRELAINNKIRPTKKPDLDNIAKIICDSLNKIAYYDDSQIVKLIVTKVYVENPETIVTIEKL